MAIIITLLVTFCAWAYTAKTRPVAKSLRDITTYTITDDLEKDWKRENDTVRGVLLNTDNLITHFTKISTLYQRFGIITASQIKEVREQMAQLDKEYKEKKVEEGMYQEQMKLSQNGTDKALFTKYQELMENSAQEKKAALIKKNEVREKLRRISPLKNVISKKVEWIEDKVKQIGKDQAKVLESWKERNETLVNRLEQYKMNTNTSKLLLKQLEEADELLKQVNVKLRDPTNNATFNLSLEAAQNKIQRERMNLLRNVTTLYFNLVFQVLQTDKGVKKMVRNVDDVVAQRQAEIDTSLIGLTGLEEMSDTDMSSSKLEHVVATILDINKKVYDIRDLLELRPVEVEKSVMKMVEDKISAAHDDILELTRECDYNITVSNLKNDEELLILKDLEKVLNNKTDGYKLTVKHECLGGVYELKMYLGIGEKSLNTFSESFRRKLVEKRIDMRNEVMSGESAMDNEKREIEVVRSVEEQKFHLERYGMEMDRVKIVRKRMFVLDEVLRETRTIEIRKLQKKVMMLQEKTEQAKMKHQLVVDWLHKEFEEAMNKTEVGVPIQGEKLPKKAEQVQLPIKHKSRAEKPYVKKDNKSSNTTNVATKSTTKKPKKELTQKTKQEENVAKQLTKLAGKVNIGKEISMMTPKMVNGETTKK
ncbi:synaptonemal complex protein, putative [Entamoeba invadens IP1]|uniref:Synaptonemal complex protein, putative n=1 Tax=Entamoeba invadens IP1 TaxID=370355 RepID=A0A0A1UE60_ENTIV|nr:synaptonemal complex protein, putative [Entamoeba invadens IP1]ELP94880.1 synaptonemal complex protein, putative [Entamoeba invadens IP1]|eukprot:XP_004261651.1 synaptonemal complex protein, putative [Entamoeba invadens IP1]